MYNEKYAWFDRLSDKDRKLFFNCLIGYLNLTPAKLAEIFDKFQKISIVEYTEEALKNQESM